MKFQFQVDNRPAAPVRDDWVDAAQDAVNAGYAIWRDNHDAIIIDSNQGASIERI